MISILLGSTTNANEDLETYQNYCKGFASIANLAMTLRQNGEMASETVDKVFNVIHSAGGKDPQYNKMALDIIEFAYNRPIVEGIENKRNLTLEFANSYDFVCMKGFESRIKK